MTALNGYFLERGVAMFDIARLVPGRITDTLMLREDGTVLNDTTVWCFASDHYALFTGRRDDLAHAHEVARGFEVTLTHRAVDHAAIAVQGTKSGCLSTSAPSLRQLNQSTSFSPAIDCSIRAASKYFDSGNCTIRDSSPGVTQQLTSAATRVLS